MKTFLASLFLLTSFSSFAVTELTCIGKNDDGEEVKIKVKNSIAKVTIKNSRIVTYKNVKNDWDGHYTGVMTATGFSLKYENHYGVIAEVVLVADVSTGTERAIRVINIEKCDGTI